MHRGCPGEKAERELPTADGSARDGRSGGPAEVKMKEVAPASWAGHRVARSHPLHARPHVQSSVMIAAPIPPHRPLSAPMRPS